MGLWSRFKGWVNSKMRERRAVSDYAGMKSLIREYSRKNPKLAHYEPMLLKLETRYVLVVKELNRLMGAYSSARRDSEGNFKNQETQFNEELLINLGVTGASKVITRLKQQTLTDMATLYNAINDVLQGSIGKQLPSPIVRRLERQRRLLSRFISRVGSSRQDKTLERVRSRRRRLWGIKDDGTSNAPTSRRKVA